MNIKLVFPIAIVVLAAASVSQILIDEYHTGEKSIENPKDNNEDLQEILNGCELKTNNPDEDVHLVTKHFMNSTHHIDSSLCEWHEKDYR